jgi:SspJ family small acid-soluble spore protein
MNKLDRPEGCIQGSIEGVGQALKVQDLKEIVNRSL